MSSLASGSPGFTAWMPSLRTVAPSGVSRRSLPLRFLASKPWQAKQLSERIGRMSRLKSSFASAAMRPVATSRRLREAERMVYLVRGRAVSAASRASA